MMVGMHCRRACAVGVVLATLAALGLVAVAAVSAAAPPSLRQADWAQASVPGSVCGSSKAVALHNWAATVGSTRWRSAPRVAVAAGHAVVYGELAPGMAAASLQLTCSNLGGTAAGQLAFAVVVYVAGKTAPRPIGVLTPRAPVAAGVHVPILEAVTITPGKVTVKQFSYGRNDPDCCPSGQATTVWAYGKSGFRPLATVVERRPAA
jgi:hypothetical protein